MSSACQTTADSSRASYEDSPNGGYRSEAGKRYAALNVGTRCNAVAQRGGMKERRRQESAHHVVEGE